MKNFRFWTGIQETSLAATLLSAVLLLAAASVSASHPKLDGSDAAEVHVWQETLPGKVVYHYRVINKEPNSKITTIAVGYDHSHGIPMLKKRPPGYKYPPENPPGGQSRICAPAGWRGKIIYTEETLDFNIEWEAKKRKDDISTGQALSGFAIEVPTWGADDSYWNSFFDVIFNGGRYLHTSTHITADTPAAVPLQNCVDPYAKTDDEEDDKDKSGDSGKDKDKDKDKK